jgi:hypothetical protein
VIAFLLDWGPVAITAVAETAFYATMFLPAYLTAATIIAIRRRQLAREAEFVRARRAGRRLEDWLRYVEGSANRFTEPLTDGEGFEPSVRFPVHTLSRRAP